MSISPSWRKFFYPHGEFRPAVLLGLIRSRHFIKMRWLITAALLGVYYFERFSHPDIRRPPEILVSILSLVVINAIWLVVGRRICTAARQDVVRAEPIIQVVWFVNAQMLVDLVVLTFLLRYTGGIENPMVIFYLFHMLIAALLLRPVNALLQGGWALLLFGGLVVGEYMHWITPHYPFLPHPIPGGQQADLTHVLTVTGTLAAGIFGILFFTLQISRRLDEQEGKLRSAMDAAERSRQAIQDLQARRSRFMQTAAHQLKSPLAGVQTLTALIHDGVVPDGEVRPTCARIIQRCRDGISQVGELLTLARIQQADPRDMRRDTCDPCQVVKELLRHYRPIADDNRIELLAILPEQSDPQGDLQVGLDATTLADCVGNLIDNAIKYTPGPGRVEVTVGPAPTSAGFLPITVTDTGIGIEPEALPAGDKNARSNSVFDAFLRGNRALAAGIPGTGLGLAIVREIAEQVGGRVMVRSVLDQGSTFTLLLPMEQPANNSLDVQDTRFSVLVSE